MFVVTSILVPEISATGTLSDHKLRQLTKVFEGEFLIRQLYRLKLFIPVTRAGIILVGAAAKLVDYSPDRV